MSSNVSKTTKISFEVKSNELLEIWSLQVVGYIIKEI